MPQRVTLRTARTSRAPSATAAPIAAQRTSSHRHTTVSGSGQLSQPACHGYRPSSAAANRRARTRPARTLAVFLTKGPAVIRPADRAAAAPAMYPSSSATSAPATPVVSPAANTPGTDVP
jgi:hypothetical protein